MLTHAFAWHGCSPFAMDICAATAVRPMLAGRWGRTTETERGAGMGSMKEILDLRTAEEERVIISPLFSEAEMSTGLFH